MKHKSFFSTIIFLLAFGVHAICSCATMQKTAKAAGRELVVKTDDALSEDAVSEHSVQEERAFLNDISHITLEVVSAPSRTTKNVAFASAYKVRAKNADGCSVPDLSLTVSYPILRESNSITYAEQHLVTDKNGEAQFMPDVPRFSFDDAVTFYPTPQEKSSDAIDSYLARGVTAPYRVRTDLLSKNGIVYVFDFNQNGKALTNSQHTLKALINIGATRLGNSPISSAHYLNQSVEQLYRATRNIVGASYSFMVAGSVKFANPVQSDGKAYTCALIADITCIDMQTGAVVYQTQQTETATAESSYKATENCRRALAAKTAHAIIYGM